MTNLFTDREMVPLPCQKKAHQTAERDLHTSKVRKKPKILAPETLYRDYKVVNSLYQTITRTDGVLVGDWLVSSNPPPVAIIIWYILLLFMFDENMFSLIFIILLLLSGTYIVYRRVLPPSPLKGSIVARKGNARGIFSPITDFLGITAQTIRPPRGHTDRGWYILSDATKDGHRWLRFRRVETVQAAEMHLVVMHIIIDEDSENGNVLLKYRLMPSDDTSRYVLYSNNEEYDAEGFRKFYRNEIILVGEDMFEMRLDCR